MQRKLGLVVLGAAGFDVMAAPSGFAALRLAAERRPDVIVSDVLMPDMDGFALCKAVRSDSALSDVPIILMSSYYLEDEDRALAGRFGASRYVSRIDGFDAVVRAVLGVLDGPKVECADLPAENLQEEHLHRIAHQLERQANIGVGLARRVFLQASALSFLDDISESLGRQLDPESMLSETLDKFLDAAGVSIGAILLRADDGQLVLKAQVGSRVGLVWSDQTEFLLRSMTQGGFVMPSVAAGPGAVDFLSGLSAASGLVVPIMARDEALGVLLLASEGREFFGPSGDAAIRAARAVSTQLGQALALSRLFWKLAAVEERNRALFDNAHDCISVTTPAGIVLEVNRQMERLLGVAREQAVGRHLSDFSPKPSAGNPLAGSDPWVAQGSAQGPIISVQRPDGTVVQAEFSSTVVEVGGERYVLHIGRDVTDRIRLEEQLRQSQKMDAVGRLAGGIAHDFNNVLSVILSYGDLMIEDLKPGEPMKDDLEEIRKAATRAAELTRQLLMFSRQQVIAPRVLDLNDLIAGIDKMLQRILGADVDLISLYAPSLGRVRANPGSVEQIIMNLVVNARDAMPTGGKLTMETANVELDEEYVRHHLGAKAGSHVMLALTDTGIGMDRATQTRIFEPFYTTKEVGKGTGLGLSTVFGIVQQSGGSICVYSEVKQGTTFKVYLPRVTDPLDSVRPVTVQTAARGWETVLLVEDDEQVRVVAREILRKGGYRILEAREAGEAVLHAERHEGTIHLLLTDVVMPMLSGPELAKRLKALRPDMRVLCMSGYTDDSIVRHGVLDSKIAYIQKPFTPAALTGKIRDVLDAPEEAAS